MSQTNSQLIEAFALSKKFSTNWVLKNVYFSISEGDRVLIKGDNGSGKTTFLKTLAGIYLPTKGEVLFSDSNLSVREDYQRISFLGDESFLYSKLTLKENLDLYLKILSTASSELKKELSAKLIHLIDIFSLNTHLDTLFERASSGSKKKTSLIRALLISSELLILDEPLVFLDKKSREVLIEELNSRTQSGQSVVIASNQESVWKDSFEDLKVYEICSSNLKEL